MRSIILLLALLALGACDRQKATGPQAAPETPPPSASEPSAKGVDRSHAGQAMPASVFKNPDGGDFTLAKAKGVPTLVNLWATWCAPCVKELPTLDRLAARHRDSGDLAVIAVSQDSGPQPSVAAFLKKLAVRDLGPFHDPDMKLTGALGVQIMPTTILYNADGKEVWRYVGDLDWTGAEAARLLSETGGARG